MFDKFSFFPQAASTIAGSVDALYLYLVVVSIVFSSIIVLALVIMSVRYHRSRRPRSEDVHGSLVLEVFWSAVPLVIALVAFAWGAQVFYEMRTIPAEGMRFLVTGKQWMWKIQHPTGQREINSLHVPLGETIILTMTSEDVIHDFFVPAFRVKQDVVPGMYTEMWFEANQVGSYHLFCAEYCGTKHSQMIGQVVVLDPADYEQWLTGQPAGLDPLAAGQVLFQNLRCDTCHSAGSGQRGPNLAGRFGTQVRLGDGQTIVFDEDYIRESLLEPRKSISAGFEPLMPPYEGQISEEQVMHLITYIKSLEAEGSGSEK